MAAPSVKAVLILDCNDGSRVHAKYYSKYFKDVAAQKAFELNLFSKTRAQSARSEAEIAMLDSTVCVFKSGIDVMFYVCGEPDENELILTTVLDAIFDSLNGILRSHLEKRTLLDNLDLVFLTVDEVIDGGLILETEPVAIANRVLMKGAAGSSGPGGAEDVPMNELTIAQALQSAREQLAKSFRN
ncbi:Coatomer subunit zeta-1 (Zeta-1-coat protein) (Zeta-1 COP) [Durusdinium trenchii]|uniref:Coatomer subunit zeta n=1 Tax=Durusdinium trenchii TaxID=1381693 RepID=A0ABP0L985_9DINO